MLAVTLVRFANDDKTRLACASKDGTLTVFSLVSEPPSLACTLRGHSRGVNGKHLILGGGGGGGGSMVNT